MSRLSGRFSCFQSRIIGYCEIAYQAPHPNLQRYGKEGSTILTNTGQFGTFDFAIKTSETIEADMPFRRKRRQARAPIEIVRPDEFDALLTAFAHNRRSDIRGRLILALMYYAGLRRSEVVNLTMNDAHLTGDDPRLEVRKTKFDKGRNIPIDPRLTPHISAWIDHRSVESRFLVCTYQLVHPNVVAVNPAPPGSQFKANGVWNTVRTALRRAEITRSIRPHMFRHSAATNWMKAGFSMREVQYLLGHENLHTTQRYLHVHDDEIAQKVYALGATTPLPTPAPRATEPAYRDCPWCAEPIRIAAIICRYCSRDVANEAC